jgi:predicted secreted protein
MAEALKNARANLTNEFQTIYTCPTATSAMVVSLLFANIDGSADISITSQWRDSSASNVPTRIASTITVPADSTLTALTKNAPLALEAGDTLEVLAAANGVVHATAVIVEIS